MRPLRTHAASARYQGASPWSFPYRVRLLLWEIAWAFLCAWTPKPFNRWRLIVLRVFGARVGRGVFVHQRARIAVPWNVEMAAGACVGDRANLYSLDSIILGEGCVIAQEAYLCTGTHDFSHNSLPLQTAPIVVGKQVFVGARSFVLPGVSLGEQSVLGACSVVTKDIRPGVCMAGVPAREISSRPALS